MAFSFDFKDLRINLLKYQLKAYIVQSSNISECNPLISDFGGQKPMKQQGFVQVLFFCLGRSIVLPHFPRKY